MRFCWRVWLGLGVLVGLLVGPPGCASEVADESKPAAGSAALDYLRHEVYDRVVLEVDMLGSATSSVEAKETILDAAKALLEKPGGVSMTFSAPDPTAQAPLGGWTLEALEAVEVTHRNAQTEGDTAILYVLYLPGAWHGDSAEHTTLGVSYGPSQLAIFPESVEGACTPGKVQIEDKEIRDLLCPLTEAATWVHELGHLLGLVDAGTPMVTAHVDAEHPYHCDNVGCIMHWSHESGDLAKYIENRLKQGNLTLNVFDQACTDDLAAYADPD